jgi:hypothetical protein
VVWEGSSREACPSPDSLCAGLQIFFINFGNLHQVPLQANLEWLIAMHGDRNTCGFASFLKNVMASVDSF